MTQTIAERDKALTTGQAARLCGVSQQTIIRCCDSGALKHWKVPGSSFRRIQPAELLRFVAAHGMEHCVRAMRLSHPHLFLDAEQPDTPSTEDQTDAA